MPDHPVHISLDKPFFGRSYPEVHKALDAPAKILKSGHRRFFHTPLEAALISMVICGNPLPGILHVALDSDCSRDPNLRKMLELMAKRK